MSCAHGTGVICSNCFQPGVRYSTSDTVFIPNPDGIMAIKKISKEELTEMYPQQEIRKTALLDELARLEHDQWCDWAKEIIDTEHISKERSERWLGVFRRDYSSLTIEEKYEDYKYAERVLWAVKKHLGIR